MDVNVYVEVDVIGIHPSKYRRKDGQACSIERSQEGLPFRLGLGKGIRRAWTILRIRKHTENPLASDARSILLRVVAMLTKMTG